jgi:hypothetical protein
MLSRSQPLRRVAMKAYKPVRTEEEKAARALVRQRSGGYCEMRLAGCWDVAMDFSHRIGRGVGGRWAASNGLDACRMCHNWCHMRPAEAKDLGLMLESWQDPTVVPVAYQNAGFVVLDDLGYLWPVA